MAKFAELRLFGQALRKTNASNTVDSVLVKECATKGCVAVVYFYEDKLTKEQQKTVIEP
mgnify:CR=1 FL=1